METKENQEKLSIYGKGDHSQCPKWKTGSVFDSGLIGVEGSLIQITPLLLCNSGPFQPRINDRMALSPLLVVGIN